MLSYPIKFDSTVRVITYSWVIDSDRIAQLLKQVSQNANFSKLWHEGKTLNIDNHTLIRELTSPIEHLFKSCPNQSSHNIWKTTCKDCYLLDTSTYGYNFYLSRKADTMIKVYHRFDDQLQFIGRYWLKHPYDVELANLLKQYNVYHQTDIRLSDLVIVVE